MTDLLEKHFAPKRETLRLLEEHFPAHEINLDSIDIKDLILFQTLLYKHEYVVVEYFWPESKKDENPMIHYRIEGNLKDYTIHKLNAYHERIRGRIDNALVHEKRCEQIYNTLPEIVKW